MSGDKDQLSQQRYNGMVTTVRAVEPSPSISPPSSQGAQQTDEDIDAQHTSSSPSSISNRPSQNAQAPEQDSTQRSESNSASHSQDLPASRRGRKGFTVNWPFQTQSIATDTLSIFTAPPPALFRRATWTPPKQGIDDLNDPSSPRDSTLIPDYVVNFIRGETPETVARRKQNGGAHGMRTVNITHHKPQRSHMAMLEGNDVELVPGGSPHGPLSARSHTTDTSTTTDMQQILPRDEKRGNAWRTLSYSGWKSGVMFNMLLSAIILIAGFVCLVVAGTKIAFLVGDGDLYTGSCSGATSIEMGLHVLINVAVMVLLVGVNYVFQVLSSPTRSEVNGAHTSRRWFEIGVPSVRNCRHIGIRRAVLAMGLLVVVLATQVIYNSLIFVSEAGFDYNLVAVQSSFLTRSPFSNSTESNGANISRNELLNLQSLAAENKLSTLSSQNCVNVLSAVFNRDYQNILLVFDDDSTSSNSLIATARGGLNASAALNPSARTSTTASQILVDGAAVSTCLAQSVDPLQDTCTVNLNGTLFIVALVLNLFTLLLTGSVFLLRRFQPLVTLGDAIASFLRDRDPSTRGNSLLTKMNLRAKMGDWGFTEGKYWAPTTGTRWFRTASNTQWLSFAFLLVSALALAAGALAYTLNSQVPEQTTLSPFGRADAGATSLLYSTWSSAAIPSLIASLPQLLLSVLYLSTNTLLTAFFLSRESALYAISPTGVKRRGLRVSAAPIGAQTTSLFLTLPRPVSWALGVWFAAMGFVLSQACFTVSLFSTGAPSTKLHIMGVGFSGAANTLMLVMICLLGLVIAGVALGLQMPCAVMADGRAVGNPLVLEGGSCSAVMSARCHRVAYETDVWWRRVAWGVVPVGEMAPLAAGGVARHVTYTAGPVSELDGRHPYV